MRLANIQETQSTIDSKFYYATKAGEVGRWRGDTLDESSSLSTC
jgi:hypothetical protein